MGAILVSSIQKAQGISPLLVAAMDDNLEMVRILANQKETDVNKASISLPSTTPIYHAARNNNMEMVKILASHGANVNVIGSDGFSPLLFACRNENPEMIKFLVDSGANVLHANAAGHNCIHMLLDSKKYNDIISFLNEAFIKQLRFRMSHK